MHININVYTYYYTYVYINEKNLLPPVYLNFCRFLHIHIYRHIHAQFTHIHIHAYTRIFLEFIRYHDCKVCMCLCPCIFAPMASMFLVSIR